MSKKTAPLELVSNDTGLTEVQLKQAHEYHVKYPNIVLAYKKMKEQENNLRGKWFALCEQLRTPATGVTLNAKEMTLILLSFGEKKSRASEIIKVVSVDDRVWADYKQNVLGFRAVLSIARGEKQAVTEDAAEADPDSGESGGQQSADEKLKPVHRPMPEDVRNLLHAIFSERAKEFTPTGKGSYTFSSLVQVGDHGRKFTVSISVDDVAK